MPKPQWQAQVRPVWPPAPGLFALALVRGGWEVPCQIRHGPAGWQAEINGELFPPHPEPAHAEGVSRIWHSARFIDQSEYRWRTAVRDQARATDPAHPSAQPKRRMLPMLLAPIQPRTPQ
jgi:hypothetical protein